MKRMEDAALSDLESRLEQYVSNVRDADHSLNGSIFDREGKKHHVETLAWNVLFRLAAAKYHCNRIDEFVDEHMKQMMVLTKSFPSGLEKNRSTLTVRHEDWKVLFELMAFLTSARSALDFLAKMISCYMKGGEFSRIGKLWKHLDNEKLSGISELVGHHWADWMEYFINYRDSMVHKLIFRSSATAEVDNVPVVRNGRETSKRIENIASFCIPRHPTFGDFVRDTNEEPFAVEDTIESEIRDQNGRVLERDISIEKSIDRSELIDVKEFTGTHLGKAISFAIETIEILSKRQFTYFARS